MVTHQSHLGLEVFLERTNARPAGHNRWTAPCPCHGSGRNQALNIRLTGDIVLIHDFGGCSTEAILEQVNMSWRELHQGADYSCNPPPRVQPVLKPDEGKRAKLERVWAEAKPLSGNDVASRYLQARGLRLDSYPTALQYHPNLPYFVPPQSGNRPLLVGHFRALVARVEHPTHGFLAVHRTFLKPDGSGKANVPAPKKLTRPVFEGATNGAAIRLYSPAERLALTEGIETALAVRKVTGWPVWACVSAGGLERVLIPPSVREVIICADNDKAGLEAADALSRRLLREGRRVRLAVPPRRGMDWLDVFLERGGA